MSGLLKVYNYIVFIFGFNYSRPPARLRRLFRHHPTSMSNSFKTLLAVAVIIVGFAAVFVLSNHLEQIKPEMPDGYADRDLALQGAQLKGFSFGAEGLLADWYWMQSLQYLGNKVINSKEDLNLENLSNLNPRLLYPYLDNATDLDPRFMAAYQYGAIVLPAIDAEKAVKFIT